MDTEKPENIHVGRWVKAWWIDVDRFVLEIKKKS